MKLSQKQIRMVEKLRQRQALFRRWRIPSLVVHSLLLVGYVILLISLSGMPTQESITSRPIFVSFIVPAVFCLGALSSSWLAYTIWNWEGDPRSELLLDLVEEAQTHND